MNDIWIVNCCAVFLFGVLGTCAVIPRIILVSSRKHLWDVPDARKIHRFSVSRLGGVAFSPMVVFAVSMLLAANSLLGHDELRMAVAEELPALSFALCAVIVLALAGMEDDLIGIRYQSKFFFQIVSGILVVAGGVWVCDLHGIVGIRSIPFWLGVPFTVLLAVFIINAINLIDGLDGLASGLSSLACLTFGLTFCLLGEWVYAVLAFSVLGVLVTFFCFNVFGNAEHGHKIFMGDTGSLTVGLMLSLLAVKLTMCDTLTACGVPEWAAEGALTDILAGSPAESSAEASAGVSAGASAACGRRWSLSGINPLVPAFSPLLVPCLDVLRVYLHRVRNGRNPFLPDKNHIHHKLLAAGMTQRGVRVTLFSVSAAFSLVNVLLSPSVNVNWIVLGDIVVYTVGNILLTRYIARKKLNNYNP